jgi:hypothetical protein
MVMKVVACMTVMWVLASTASAAAQDTKPAQATADALIQAIVAKNFDAFKALCASKVQEEHAKNPKNCKITRWWDSAQKELTEHKATWVYKAVKSNYPKNVTLTYTRSMDSGETAVDIGVILEGDKWLVDSAGSL